MTQHNITEKLTAHFTDPTSMSTQDAHQLMTDLRMDPFAQAQFNVLASADRALHDEMETPSSFEQSFGELAFLGALDEMLEEESPSETQNTVKTATIIPWPKRSIFVALAAVCLAVLFANLMVDQSQKTTFQPRGIHTPTTTPDFTGANIDVFCATKNDDATWQFKHSAAFEFGVLACPVKAGHIKLSYINPHPELKYISIVGVDEAGAPLWYLPNPIATQSIQIKTTKTPTPIGQTIALAINHKPGTVRIHGIFSKTPMDHATLEQALDGVDPVSRFNKTLSIPGTFATSMTIDLLEQP